MKTYQYNQALVIGLDPGESTGVARFDPESQQMVDIRTLTFWETIFFLSKHNPDVCLVICEDPNKNQPVFGAERILAQSGPGGLARRGQNVGMNKGDAKRICEWLRLYEFPHIKKRPKGYKVPAIFKTKAGKLSQYGFEQLTGLSWKCNEHERDAAMMVDKFPYLQYLAHINNK